MLLKDKVLENVAGAGVKTPESKYNVGDTVRFYDENDKDFWGVVKSLLYRASEKTWLYEIDTGAMFTYCFIAENRIFFKKS